MSVEESSIQGRGRERLGSRSRRAPGGAALELQAFKRIVRRQAGLGQ